MYRNRLFEEMITGSAAPSLPSFLPFYLLRFLNSADPTIPRSLEQATEDTPYEHNINNKINGFWLYNENTKTPISRK